MAGDELPPLDNRYHRGILSCAAVYEPPWPAYRQVRSHNNYPTIENSPLWKKKRRETFLTYVFLQRRTSTTWPARSDPPKVCPNQTNWEEFRLYRHHSINVWSSIKLTVFFFSSVENLLPPPDSAFQLGDLFPMVKVINQEVITVFISKKGGFRGHFESRYHQVMKNFLWLGCRFPLCVHKTKSLGFRGEDKSRWGGGGGAGGQESLLEGLAHWGRDCWGFYCLPFRGRPYIT